MSLTQILKEKKETSLNIKKTFGLPLKNKALALIKLNDKSILQKLYFGLANLDINFIIVGDFDKNGIDENFKNIYITNKINNTDLIAFDFTILDSNITDIGLYQKNAIVSILPTNNHLSSICKEYNPMKSEGNSYLYQKHNEWSIFHAITRYYENYKISFDNKNLVKNVLEI
ncbi:MAG: hypothetical protein Q9M94_01800 [Candidatus Gracilibacteria bacterium]|nr:hypothetical protein [Candidatus Gracilibacteria bacterium]MDQ7023079.1 hypothetical protein [Candidatus Gracilibacteria bacterium]